MKKVLLFVILVSIVTLSVGVASAIADSKADDKKRCEMYKKRLKKYKKEGVMGINPTTGKKAKMKGEDARFIIQTTKDNVEMFCE